MAMITTIMGTLPRLRRQVGVEPGVVALHTSADTPAARPGEAVIDVLACGICGTDLHLLHGMQLPPRASYPVHPGHEVAGVVRSIEGDALAAAEHGVTVGDLVVLHPVDPCRTCPTCLDGAEQLCQDGDVLGIHRPGGLSDTVTWPIDRLVVANGLAPTRAAILADAVATALRAARLAGLPAGGRACVLGAGGVGTHVLQLLRAADPRAELVGVVGSPPSAQRLAAAGYDVELAGDDLLTRLRARHRTYDAVIDFSSQADSPALGVRLLGPGGTLVLGSVLDGRLDLGPAVAVQTRELTVRGAYASSLEDLREAVRLARSGALDLSDSVSHVRALDDAVAAFAELQARPAGLVRMVLTTSPDVR
jgi:2-desacetyl-2-hydroxyethyl bacteriochlorophyllide A dehydrogenase